MADPSISHTCLSEAKHQACVLDVTVHYFGCLRESERREFFDGLPRKLQRRIERELCRIARLRSDFEAHPNTEGGSLLKSLEESLRTWRSPQGGNSQQPNNGPYKRISRDIRSILQPYNQRTCPGEDCYWHPDDGSEETAFRCSHSTPQLYGRRANPDDDNSWPLRNGSEPRTFPSRHSTLQSYNGMGDHGPWGRLSAGHRSEEGVFRNSFSAGQPYNQTTVSGREKLSTPGSGSGGSVDSEIKASIIFFKDSRPYDIPDIENEFPNQKMSVRDLLAEDRESNPLMQPCEDNMIRYFHFPANNMIWVEEAMARYYHERRPESGGFFLKSRRQGRSKTQMLLRPEYWQGQQQGEGKASVHARHMRPLCEAISINPVSMEMSPKNLVLFMPYLHWETDRGRRISANVIKKVSESKLSIVEFVSKAAANERAARGDRDVILDDADASPPAPRQSKTLSKPEKTPSRREALGQIFWLAAALAEAMDYSIEEKLTYEYLHKQPPLHPRRTLDQSYYGALKSTQARDRDQVVYRATVPASHTCTRDPAKDMTCQQCNEESRKVPRLIMVDQLWLWILDENTVITCFPRRWGRHNPDPAAVHKRLRLRLETAREGEIHSGFDLALIIVDQCSRVFFDRTQTNDRQPNLVDIFADAIREVTYKQTAAFDQFLIYTHLASKEYSSRCKSGTTAAQNTLLNINLEGNLLKEAKDILDELHIMTQIKLQQQSVAESFIKHIKRILFSAATCGESAQMVTPTETRSPRPSDGESLLREESKASKWTLSRADDLLENIRDRISELNTLRDTAKNTSSALKDLLKLKQQQAAVLEARETVAQATEACNQGHTIMIFTVVTIIFLPLSFGASIFGMNAVELNPAGSKLTLGQELKYMLPASFAIICISFLLAFYSSSFLSAVGSFVWTVLAFPANVAVTWVLTKTGLYVLSRDSVARANGLRNKEQKITGTMMANAMRKKMNLTTMKEENRAKLQRYLAVDDDVEKAQSGRM